MAQSPDPNIAGYECKHVIYSTARDGEPHDLATIKEVIHFKDGSTKPNLRYLVDYRRPYWITREGWRTHKDKKEWEDEKKLMRCESTQINLPNAILRSLGQIPTRYVSLRQACRSPYVYGADVTTPVLLKRHYMDTWPEYNSGGTKETIYSVCMFDTETDVVKGHERIIAATVAMGAYVHLFVTEEFLGAEARDAEAKLRKAFTYYLNEYQEKRHIDYHVTIVKDEGELAYQALQAIHRLRPDILAIWNMDFDIPKMIKALERAGYDLGEVFSDPSVPPAFKKFVYHQGASQKVTQSGKTMPLPYFDRWHSVECPASFQVIDAMCLYRKLRFAKGMEDGGYSLDAVLERNLGIRKLKFKEAEHVTGLQWHAFMQKNYKIEYCIYNNFDCISMQELDEKTKDMCMQLAMHSGHSEWNRFPSQPRRTWDDLNFECFQIGRVAATTSDQMRTELDLLTVDLSHWIVTLPSHLLDHTGLQCVDEVPNYHSHIWAAVADLDISATYPSVEKLCNISKETTMAEIIAVEGLDENQRRAVGINLTGGFVNATEICVRVFKAPTFETLLADFTGEVLSDEEAFAWHEDGSGIEEADDEVALED